MDHLYTTLEARPLIMVLVPAAAWALRPDSNLSTKHLSQKNSVESAYLNLILLMQVPSRSLDSQEAAWIIIEPSKVTSLSSSHKKPWRKEIIKQPKT